MVNLNLIKCVIGKHNFGEPIKDETLRSIVKICKHCSFTVRTMNELRVDSRKEEIIKDIKEDRLVHAKNNLTLLLNELGYK